MSTENVIVKLESTLSFLSATEQMLGTYILEHKEEIVNMSTQELASRSGVSEATVIRLSKKLGLNGYSDFKLKLSANLATPDNLNPLKKIQKHDSAKEILSKVVTSTINSLENTRSIIDETELQKAASLVSATHENNGNIYIVAVGASGVVAKALQIKLMRLKVPTIYYEDTHLSLESVLSITEQDTLIVISTLGKSAHIHNCLDIASKKKASKILLTQYGNEYVANKGDICLLTATMENNLRLASQTALIVQMVVADTLFIALALTNLDEITRDVQDSREFFKECGYNLE